MLKIQACAAYEHIITLSWVKSDSTIPMFISLLVSWWNGKNVKRFCEWKLGFSSQIFSTQYFCFNFWKGNYIKLSAIQWFHYNALSKLWAKYCMKIVFQRKTKTIGPAKWYLYSYSIPLKVRWQLQLRENKKKLSHKKPAFSSRSKLYWEESFDENQHLSWDRLCCNASCLIIFCK